MGRLVRILALLIINCLSFETLAIQSFREIDSDQRRYLINDDAAGKYECRCFVNSSTGHYHQIFELINYEHSITRFIEDLDNGGIQAEFDDWNPETQKLTVEDEGSRQCFDPSGLLQILKRDSDRVFVQTIDSRGIDIGTWVSASDLKQADTSNPEIQARERRDPLLINRCMF